MLCCRHARPRLAARSLAPCRSFAAKRVKLRRGKARDEPEGPSMGSGRGASRIAIQIRDVNYTLPSGREILRKASLKLENGDKVGIIGANGAGKSTLLRLFAGTLDEATGEVWRQPDKKIGVLEQEPTLDDDRSVLDNVLDGVAEERELLRRLDEVNDALEKESLDAADAAKLIDEQEILSEQIEALGCWKLYAKVDTTMSALNCPSGDAMPSTLSGGQRRRVALARLIIAAPQMLLLDEPTNHLDASSVSWLETWLDSHEGTVVAITHDRYFLDNVAKSIIEVDSGDIFVVRGNYSRFLERKTERLRVQEQANDSRTAKLQAELSWIQKAKSAGRSNRARLRSYAKLLEESNAAKHADRVQGGAIEIVPGPRLGKSVLKVTGLSKSYGERLLFRDLTFDLPAGAIMGIVGPNGTGKSTLLRIISGLEDPDEGEVKLGPTTSLGYVDQSRDGLDPQKTCFQEISQGQETLAFGEKEVNMRAYVAAFNLRGTTQEKLVGKLSGGERGRVHLAKTLRGGHNLLMLDEPSNDLDVDTLRSLEDALRDFAGSAIVISHDRWFLDRVCDHTLGFESDGSVEFYVGSVSEYYSWRERRRPQRVNLAV